MFQTQSLEPAFLYRPWKYCEALYILGWQERQFSSFVESVFGIPILSASTGAGFLILSLFAGFVKPKPVRHLLKKLLLTPPRGPPCPREIEGDSFEAVRKLVFL